MTKRTVKFRTGCFLLINREKKNKFPVKWELKREKTKLMYWNLVESYFHGERGNGLVYRL